MEPIHDDLVITLNHRGTVSFATLGKNMHNTQCSINIADNWYLYDQGLAPIEGTFCGRLVWGIEFIEQFYARYGEDPNQSVIREEGKAYLEEEFPLLSYFVKIDFVCQDGEFQR